MTMPETTQSDLPDGCPTCGALPCDWAVGGVNATKTVEALIAEREKIESQMDGGRFEDWPTATFVGQLRMQSRDSLDPEYSQFMAATATHMGILSGQCDAQREIAESAKEEAARLRAHCEAMSRALEPFAKAGSIAGERNPYGNFYAYRPAAGDDFAIFGDHLREANRILAAYRGENAS